jgi:hypothetical protein
MEVGNKTTAQGTRATLNRPINLSIDNQGCNRSLKLAIINQSTNQGYNPSIDQDIYHQSIKIPEKIVAPSSAIFYQTNPIVSVSGIPIHNTVWVYFKLTANVQW